MAFTFLPEWPKIKVHKTIPDAILRKITPENVDESLKEAATLLRRPGGLVVFPTETVYGLGASALNDESAEAIYSAKGRPSDNPLIVHVSSRDMLYDLVPGGQAGVPKAYEALIDRFMPGPLTLVFPLSSQTAPKRRVSDRVTAGQASVAIRMPENSIARALIAAADLPLAAPSANLSSRPSPTTAEHAFQDLGRGRGVGMILDGGPCGVGLESTVVDFKESAIDQTGKGSTSAPSSTTEIRILRAGGVSAADIEACLRESKEVGGGGAHVKVYGKDFTSKILEEKPTTPGMKYKHYAPGSVDVVLVKKVDESSSLLFPDSLSHLLSLTAAHSAPACPVIGLLMTDATLASLGFQKTSETPLALPSIPHISFIVQSLGSTPEEAAQRLFAGLRFFDTVGQTTAISVVLVESIPEDGVGMAVMERARKSAGGRAEVTFRV